MRPSEKAAADKAARLLEPLVERFAGRTALVFASGPSLDRLWSADRVIPFPSIAVNDAFRIAPGADVLLALDQAWWIAHRDQALRFSGVLVTHDSSSLPGVIAVKSAEGKGYDPRLGWIRHGSNSGYSAVHLAAQLGGNPIVLVGFDMREVNGRSHFFGNHPALLRNQQDFEAWALNFRGLKRALDSLGIRVLNATPGSRITCFPFVDLEEVCEFHARSV